jgi:hypothetical protein
MGRIVLNLFPPCETFKKMPCQTCILFWNCKKEVLHCDDYYPEEDGIRLLTKNGCGGDVDNLPDRFIFPPKKKD